MGKLNIETKKSMNTVELKKEINGQGCSLDIIYVNGQPFVNIGYVSEADKEACLKAVQTAVDNSDTLMEAKMKLQNCCELTAAGIDPDEEVVIEGYKIMISYKERKAYSALKEVANLDDLSLPSVGKDVILALLTDRVKLYLATLESEADDEYECDDGLEEDYYTYY